MIDRLWESPEQGITPYVQRPVINEPAVEMGWRGHKEDITKGRVACIFNTQEALEPQLSFLSLDELSQIQTLDTQSI